MDNNPITAIEGVIVPDYVNRRLKEIADLLINDPGTCDNPGMNGVSGIIIFLFHYAEYSNQDVYRKFAESVVADVRESVGMDSPIGYADGLAGLGCSFLYLSKKGFINSFTAEYFKELDRLISRNSRQGNNIFLNSLTGITGLGKYYIARLNHAHFQTAGSDEFNKKALSEIIDALDPPYASYSEIIHAIHILGELYSFSKANLKAKNYLDYSLDKLETIRYEDRFFCNKYQVHDDLRFALALLIVSELSGDLKYGRVGLEILENDSRWRSGSLDQKNVFNELPPERWFLYHILAYKVNDRKLGHIIARLLGAFAGRSNSLQRRPETDLEDYGLINGYAGLGMHLLTATGAISHEWFHLIPIVY